MHIFSIKKRVFVALIGGLVWYSNVTAQVHDWTYTVSVTNAQGQNPKTFYLWLPPQALGIRGVILTSVARLSQLSGDSSIRETCRAYDLGIMGCLNLDGFFNPADTIYINNALAAFSEMSRLPELKYVPLASYGTSVGGIFAWEVAFAYPNRFFAIIQDNSNYTKKPAWAQIPHLTNVPLLSSRGYNEPVNDKPWETRDSILAQRRLGLSACYIVQAGGGHFGWTKWESGYMARWLRKAVQARLPLDQYPRSGFPDLAPISLSAGWLSDTAITSAQIQVGEFSQYAGDPDNAYWHFDEEMAMMWKQIHEGQFQRTAQIGGFGNAQLDACENPWAQCAYIPNLATVEEILPQAQTNAGLPIRYGIYNGPFTSGANSQSVKIEPALIDESPRGWIVAMQEGNTQWQAWERAVSIRVEKKNSGTDQTISFLPLPDVSDSVSALIWQASSNSGLPVSAFIRCGPARIQGNQIQLLPFAGDSGAMAPVVVRYTQRGNAEFRTATIRSDTFFVRKSSPLPTQATKWYPAKKTFAVFPNPGQQVLGWDSGFKLERIQIISTKGNTVADLVCHPTQPYVQLPKLATGLYYVMGYAGQKCFSTTWLKE